MSGDKECPFSGVTKSGRVWRKVPESDARSVRAVLTSRWPALECPVLMVMMWGFMYPRIARDIRTLTNRAQLSHATNLPILTGNRRVGEGKGVGRVLHQIHTVHICKLSQAKTTKGHSYQIHTVHTCKLSQAETTKGHSYQIHTVHTCKLS